MILKHEDKKNGAMYWSADEFVVKSVLLDFGDGFSPVNDVCIDEPLRPDFGRNIEEFNAVANMVYEKTGWGFTTISLVTELKCLTDVGKKQIIAVLPKTQWKKYPVLVFSDWTWLMTDNGKTIEKLI